MNIKGLQCRKKKMKEGLYILHTILEEPCNVVDRDMERISKILIKKKST